MRRVGSAIGETSTATGSMIRRMTSLAIATEDQVSAASRLIAGEIRAEMARQGISQRALAQRIHMHQSRLSARIGVHASLELTFVDVLRMTEALNVSVERFLSPLLPRLDSNQQPSGYPSSQVSGLDSDVTNLEAWRRRRAIACLPGQSVDELHRRLAVAR